MEEAIITFRGEADRFSCLLFRFRLFSDKEWMRLSGKTRNLLVGEASFREKLHVCNSIYHKQKGKCHV